MFLLNFLEFFFNSKFFLKINILNSFFNSNDFIIFNNKYKKNNFKFNKFFYFNEVLEIIWISFFNKDLFFIKNWIIKIIGIIDINNHKKFFIIFQEIIFDNFNLFFDVLKIKGFYFCVKGKIGFTGNAKKKIFFFKKGKFKLSSKKLKIDNQIFNIKTDSGSLGFNIILSY